MLIDTHCHLDFEDFSADRAAVIGRARAAGIGRMITISTKVEKIETIFALAEAEADIFCTVGTHPLEAEAESDVSCAHLVELAQHPKCVGIGEAGLDYHYDRAPRDLAERVLRTHIAAARETGLPLVIHNRESDADMARILADEMGKGRFKALLHCFSACPALAETGLALGLFLSFSGVLTFKKAEELRVIARSVPLDRLLVETDAPYLAPVPYRGKRNEPAFVAATAKMLAEVKGVSEAELAAATTANALRLFSKMPALDTAAAAE